MTILDIISLVASLEHIVGIVLVTLLVGLALIGLIAIVESISGGERW